ncbi:MAG TPA: GYD domain-containing protein [Rubrobacteraceae bacterium]|nr:GYD domain-containing protein [Rubrobacteraceae bacterium]
MPLYMTQVGYTSEAWAALTRNPEDRSEAFGGLAESMGGRLVSFYNSFGEYDLLVIYEAPDETTAAAIVLAAVSPGHLSKVKTTVLLSAQDGMEAMRKAGGATYRAPGQQ